MTLDDIIEEVGAGPRFPLPGALCAPVFLSAEADGAAMRTLLATVWLASPTIREGVEACFEVPAASLRHAAGFASYRCDKPMRRAVEILTSESCGFADGGVSSVYEDLTVSDTAAGSAVRWTFSPDFASLFLAPGRYGMLDLRDVVRLRSGLDLLLYRQASLVRNMRRPEFAIAVDDLRVSTGIIEAPFKRVMARVDKALGRIRREIGVSLAASPVRGRGSRRAEAVRFSISPEDALEGQEARPQ